MAGIVRTRVGYAGGTKVNPTYHDLGDHTETIQLDYDPEKLAYSDLLEVFWNSHSPCRTACSRQYAAAIFVHDQEQQQAASVSREREATRRGQAIVTDVVPAETFYLAEDYHQKYRLRQIGPILRDFLEMYPDPRDLVNSCAAARVNGYLGGYGELETALASRSDLGLSPDSDAMLQRIVEGLGG